MSYSKYLCVLDKVVYEGKLDSLLNKNLVIPKGENGLDMISVKDYIPELEDLSSMELRSSEVLGIIEAHNESEARMIAKSKFRGILEQYSSKVYDLDIEVIDIETITY